MDYSLRDFLRHMQMWPQVQNLSVVEPLPEQGRIGLRIVPEMGESGVHYRIMHMLSKDGCTPQQRKYRGLRFFAMNQFLNLHSESFQKAGFIMIDDGEKVAIPGEITRAVHDTFKGEPLVSAFDQSVDEVIARAKVIQGQR